jgi:hypothetical protein
MNGLMGQPRSKGSTSLGSQLHLPLTRVYYQQTDQATYGPLAILYFRSVLTKDNKNFRGSALILTKIGWATFWSIKKLRKYFLNHNFGP